MPNNYTPVPTKFTGTVTEPADGDAPTAASVTVGTRKLANGLAYLESATSVSPPLNFSSGPAETFTHGAWDPHGRRWMVVEESGGNGYVRASYDTGHNFDATDLLAGAGIGILTKRIATSTAGAAVVTTNSQRIFEMTAAGTWTYHATAMPFSPDSGKFVEVIYNPITAKWLAFCTGVTNKFFVTSSDRVTWTSHTINTASGTGTAFASIAVNTTTGRMVAIQQPLPASDGKVEIATSLTDGADFPVSNTVITHGLTATSQGVRWNEGTGLFVMFVSSTTQSKIYTSSNGTSWTLVATLTTASIKHMTSTRDVLLADIAFEFAYSTDGGTTWRYTDYQTESLTHLIASPNQFLGLGSTLVYLSFRAGAGGSLVT